MADDRGAHGRVVGYSHNHGPPRLQCSAPWALTQLRTMDADHPAVRAATAALEAADRGELTITIDWGGLAVAPGAAPAAVELVIHEQAREEPVARASLALGEACALGFRASAPGALYIVTLLPAGRPPAAWSRTLHVLAPFPAAWRNQAYVCFTALAPRLEVGGLAELRVLASPLPRGGPPIDRGFGLELELLSVPPDAERGHFSKAAELGALLDSAERAAADAPEPERAALRALLDRVRRWQISLDPACLPFPCLTAESLLPQMRALGSRDDADALAMLTERRRTIPTEYKSPLPPHELSFGRETAALAEPGERPSARLEAALGLRLICRLGVCAPSASESGCEPNTSLHVHVNVRNAQARGRLLSAREILAVWLSWVRFEHVTLRLCRSWCWADRWAAPLLATGSEFTFNERPLARGESAHLARAAANDVPAFFLRAHGRALELAGSEAWAAADESRRVEHLFGAEGCGLGKYNSLNLLPLRTYGTLEFRRQHASTDADFVARWAHFCVGFVEGCADEALLRPYLELDAREALRRLQREQRMATPDELEEQLGGFCEPDLLARLRASGCGPHVLGVTPATEEEGEACVVE